LQRLSASEVAKRLGLFGIISGRFAVFSFRLPWVTVDFGTEGNMENIAEAYMDELAKRVAAKVLAELRRAPVVRPLLVGVKEAAQMLGRTERAVRALLLNGSLRNSSPDGRVQIAVKDIERWIQNNQR